MALDEKSCSNPTWIVVDDVASALWDIFAGLLPEEMGLVRAHGFQK
jgi:hypothetical protein